MKSMTGFGGARVVIGGHSLNVQISSVNRKTLDLTQKLPSDWSELEPEIAERVRKAVARGKVHVNVSLGGASEGDQGIVWDEAAVGRTLGRLKRLAEERSELFTVTPELLWSVVNAHRQSDSVLKLEGDVRDQVLETLGLALEAFVQMREKEGRALQADLFHRIEFLARQVETIAGRAPRVPSHYREQLHKRLRELGLEIDIGDERVLKEIALFVDRCDISEELTRLRSHLGQLRALLQGEGEVGRKAEFILQEIGREIHTIGSKANDLEIARCVIEMKNESERIREQIANIE